MRCGAACARLIMLSSGANFDYSHGCIRKLPVSCGAKPQLSELSRAGLDPENTFKLYQAWLCIAKLGGAAASL